MNKEAKRSLKVVWNKIQLEKTPHQKYLDVTLDQKLGYKQHIHNTKVATHTNLLRKLSNWKLGVNTSTIRTTALALRYSMSKYAALVWGRWPLAHKLNTELNSACKAVIGCRKATDLENMYLLRRIAQPYIMRGVCARMENTKQETNEAHSLYEQDPAERRTKSWNCFLLNYLLRSYGVMNGLWDCKQ